MVSSKPWYILVILLTSFERDLAKRENASEDVNLRKGFAYE